MLPDEKRETRKKLEAVGNGHSPGSRTKPRHFPLTDLLFNYVYVCVPVWLWHVGAEARRGRQVPLELELRCL